MCCANARQCKVSVIKMYGWIDIGSQYFLIVAVNCIEANHFQATISNKCMIAYENGNAKSCKSVIEPSNQKPFEF